MRSRQPTLLIIDIVQQKTQDNRQSYRTPRSQIKEIEGRPIDPANRMAPIISLRTEVSVAGYIGFGDSTQLRHFVCIQPVLQIQQIWQKEIGSSYKRDQFAFISRRLNKLEAAFDPHESWPLSENDDDKLEKFKYRIRICQYLVHLKNAPKDYVGFSDEENAYISSLQLDEVSRRIITISRSIGFGQYGYRRTETQVAKFQPTSKSSQIRKKLIVSPIFIYYLVRS